MKKPLPIIAILIAVSISLISFNDVFASNLIFTGQNAGLFNTANPSDTAALMNSVVKPNNPAAGVTSPQSTALLIQEAVASQLSTEIFNTIIASGNSTSGTFSTGDGGIISYTRDAGGILTVVITDPNGKVTTLDLGNLQ